jgi:acyl carrier protein
MNAITTFLADLASLLEIDQSMLTADFYLNSTANWDSLTIVSTIALLDQYFNIKTEGKVLEDCKTIEDLLNLTVEYKEV